MGLKSNMKELWGVTRKGLQSLKDKNWKELLDLLVGSKLVKCIFASVIIHVFGIGLFSMGMFFDTETAAAEGEGEKPGETKTQEPAKKDSKTETGKKSNPDLEPDPSNVGRVLSDEKLAPPSAADGGDLEMDDDDEGGEKHEGLGGDGLDDMDADLKDDFKSGALK